MFQLRGQHVTHRADTAFGSATLPSDTETSKVNPLEKVMSEPNSPRLDRARHALETFEDWNDIWEQLWVQLRRLWQPLPKSVKRLAAAVPLSPLAFAVLRLLVESSV